MGYTQKFLEMPASVQGVLELAVSELDPGRIILFGSRARGTHRETSDFDLAFWGLAKKSQWTKFLAEVEEQTLTLYDLDLLQYESTSDQYKKAIDSEGVTLYER